jgi:hypothetical protein
MFAWMDSALGMEQHDKFASPAPGTLKQLWGSLGAPLALVLLLGASSCLWSAAEVPRPTQYDVEAAYLFNFGKFVTWPVPVGANATFLICILGEDPFGATLDKTIAGETLNGQKVEERRISRPQETTSCSILYISSSESSRLSKILPLLKDIPVLTVSDMPEFAEHGGIIQFVLREGRVRFLVNLGPTQTDGLTLSSELLKVALEVIPPKGGR